MCSREGMKRKEILLVYHYRFDTITFKVVIHICLMILWEKNALINLQKFNIVYKAIFYKDIHMKGIPFINKNCLYSSFKDEILRFL